MVKWYSLFSHTGKETEAVWTRLPGTLRLPGGGASVCTVSADSSGLKTTFKWWMSRCRSSLRITRARGQP